jgi:hypothetical protein
MKNLDREFEESAVVDRGNKRVEDQNDLSHFPSPNSTHTGVPHSKFTKSLIGCSRPGSIDALAQVANGNSRSIAISPR